MADYLPAQNQVERQAAQRNLSDLASEFLVADEWSVFSKTAGIELKAQIVAKVDAANRAIASDNIPACEQCVLEGRALLNTAQGSRPIWFLGNTRFGILPILFTIVSGVIAFKSIFIGFLHLTTPECIHHPAFLGFSGAILKSLYWLQRQINKGMLRPRWFAYFIVAPFVGSLLGGMTALLVKASVKMIQTGAGNEPDWKVVGLLAAFAGFNWEWALEKIRYGAEAVAAKVTEKNKAPVERPKNT